MKKILQEDVKFSIIYFPYNNSRYTDIILQSMIYIYYKYFMLHCLTIRDAVRFPTTHPAFSYGDILSRI